MPDLNLRNVEPSLLAKLKSDAALNGVTLREHCIGLLAFGSSALKQRIGLQYDAAFTKQNEILKFTAHQKAAFVEHASTCKCLMCKPPKPS